MNVADVDKSTALSRTECIALGIRSGFPLGASSGLLGILYGATCISLGISAEFAVLASAVVFSGAVQFVILGLLNEPLAWGAIAISSFLVCNRFILMGASIADHIREVALPARIFAMQALTDGSWAATIAEHRHVHRFTYFVSVGLCILLFWVAGTLVGVLGAGLIDEELIASLRFSGVLFLFLLLLLVVRNTRFSHVPWVAASGATLIASLFVPLAVAFIVGVACGARIAWRQNEGGADVDG